MIERERIGQKKREPKANNILLSPVLTNTFMIINFSSIGNPLSSSFDLSSLSCPCCRARGLMTYHSSYRRFFVSVDQPDTPLFVPIVYCPSCHSFHVVLPHSACPFSSFSYGFIFEVLLQYCSGPYPGNKSRTAALFGISRTTLRRWIHRYISLLFYAYILLRDLDLDSYSLLLRLRARSSAFLKAFLRFHDRPFFSRHVLSNAAFSFGFFPPS